MQQGGAPLHRVRRADGVARAACRGARRFACAQAGPLRSRAARAVMGLLLMLAAGLLAPTAGHAAMVGAPSASQIALVADGKSDAIIVRAPSAGRWERAAADDLAKYIGLMTGAKLTIADTPEDIARAMSGHAPLIVIGQEALAARPDLYQRLGKVLKPHPYIRTDGIVLLRERDRIYLAGNNDDSHYFAAAEFLRRLGVRWFMPGEFGECVPEDRNISVGDIDYVYASPFEVRSYWVSWLGDQTGREYFQARNMLTVSASVPPNGHALGNYTKGLGKSEFNVPFSDPRTVAQILEKVSPLYAADKSFSLSISDGLYSSDNADDRALMSLQWDPRFQTWSVTDAVLKLYAAIAERLREKYPTSAARIGFLIYANMTLPPVRDTPIDPMFFGVFAPIDFDPIHAMGDERSPEKQDMKRSVEKWTTLLKGRIAIYDYDQSMLVWRDLPNPSHMAFERDVKTYRDMGVAGFVTESRNALATTFTNLYMRGRLMWDPDADAAQLLDDFYPRFFGPAAAPMKAYWEVIFTAWSSTLATEHESFVAPAIYRPELVAELARHLDAAQAALAPLRAKPEDTLGRNEKLYLQRMEFVRLSFEVLHGYVAMVGAAATNADYASAVAAGEAALKARDALTDMNKAFTTTRLEKGWSFWPGEVQYYRDLQALVDGTKGTLIAKLPLEWAFRRDPRGEGERNGYASAPPDLSHWTAHGGEYDVASRKDYPDAWEMLRTDLYAQAQGVRFPDQRNYAGDVWYRTTIDLTAAQAAAGPHIMFPGVFNTCELYVAGKKVAERKQKVLWWANDYRFQWDVPLGHVLREGANDIALRCGVPGHMGGMFRRPFIYAPLPVRG